jgi:hypothetical protein
VLQRSVRGLHAAFEILKIELRQLRHDRPYTLFLAAARAKRGPAAFLPGG